MNFMIAGGAGIPVSASLAARTDWNPPAVEPVQWTGHLAV